MKGGALIMKGIVDILSIGFAAGNFAINIANYFRQKPKGRKGIIKKNVPPCCEQDGTSDKLSE